MGLSSKQVSEVRDLDIPSVAINEKNNDEAMRVTNKGPTLKCPRCDSSNTKFCYYNNYSRLQPRHFCRACKRHWTAGGTLRNVPVGGSSRKSNKTLTTAPKSTKHHSKTNMPAPPPFVVPLNNSGEIEGAIFPDIFSRVLCPAAADVLVSDKGAGNLFSGAASSSSDSSVYGLQWQQPQPQQGVMNMMEGFNHGGGWLQDDLSLQLPSSSCFWNYSLDDGVLMDFHGAADHPNNSQLV